MRYLSACIPITVELIEQTAYIDLPHTRALRLLLLDSRNHQVAYVAHAARVGAGVHHLQPCIPPIPAGSAARRVLDLVVIVPQTRQQ